MRRWHGMLLAAVVYGALVWISGVHFERSPGAAVLTWIGICSVALAALFPGYREDNE